MYVRRRWSTALAALLLALPGWQPAAAAAPGAASPQASAQAIPAAAGQRHTQPLMQGWHFTLDDALQDTQALQADTAAWERVALPHTWNALDAATTVQTTPASQPYRRGIGWYQLRFDATLPRGGTQWLEFDAASITATVWLNGQRLGEHRGAFTAFRFDVTKLLRPQGNVLLVKTDNRRPLQVGGPTTIIPLSGDFNMAGGLYRGVRLVATASPAHIALDDHGGPGVYARTLALGADGSARVEVLTRLRQHGSTTGRHTLRTQVLHADGRRAAPAVNSPLALAPGGQPELTQQLRLPQARLWQGLQDPYQYRVQVELLGPDGRVLDRVEQPLGVRVVAADPERGFLLNGQPLRLRGVNMHQDFQAMAWAITPQQTAQSLAILREMGANALRLAHYPHAQDTYAQADAQGWVVMAELPFVNSTAIAGYGPRGCEQALADPESNGIADNARQQLMAMLRQLHNHPSIAFWSLANEVTTFACGQTTERNNVTPMLRSLQVIARREDPLRITTLADQVTRRGDTLLPDPISIAGLADSYGVNRYFQWYYGTSETQLGEHLDDLRRTHPGLPIGLTEYGAGSAVSHHTDNPRGGRPCQRDLTGARRICPQPEGYAAYVHEHALAAIEARPWLFGSFIWNGFDFGSGIRHEGDIGATNTKGVVSFSRELRKDSYYLFQANWSQAPVIRVAGRRHVERAYPVADVVVYSNAERTTLLLDDREVQSLDAAQCPLRTCTFRNVRLPTGASMLTAMARHGQHWVTDAVHWRLGPDNAENFFITAGQLVSGIISNDPLLGRRRYGSDHFFEGGEASVATHNGPVQGIGEAQVPADPRVWDQYRAGERFAYRVPVPAGRYRVTLGFLSKEGEAPQAHVFDVLANGSPLLQGIDIAAAAGAPHIAVTRSAEVSVGADGLHLAFVARSGQARVSNLAVVRLP